MFDDLSGCYSPTWPVSMDDVPRLTVTKFGDGYEQRTLDGINWLDTTWKLKWIMRPRDVLLAMDAYLTAQQATSFPFYDPTTMTILYVFCDKWTVSWSYKGQLDNYGDMDAEFRSANGEGIIGPTGF